jgi:hypothetical protein
MKAIEIVKSDRIPSGGKRGLNKSELELLEAVGDLRKGTALKVELKNYSQRERVKLLCRKHYPDTEFEYPTRKGSDDIYYTYITMSEVQS